MQASNKKLPPIWKKVKLGEMILEVVSGGRPPGGSLRVSHGVPSIGAEHLNDTGGFDFSKIKYVPEEYYKKSTRGKIKLNDILCVKDGATIGKVSLITRHFPFSQAMVNEHVYIVRTKQELLDQVFLYYKLRTREGQEMIKNSIRGSAQGGLTRDFLDNWTIYIPSLDEQKRIADFLSAFDDKIELNEKIIRTIEKMAMTIFEEWFVHLRFPGYEKIEFVDSELGKIPKGWRVGNLGEIMIRRVERVKSYKEWMKEKLLDLGRFPRKSLAMVSYGKGEEIKSSVLRFKEGDILFGAVRPYFHKVLIAPFNGVTNASVFIIYPSNAYYYCFLVCTLFSDSTIAYATRCASGTKMPVLKWEDLCSMQLVIPEESILYKFNEIVNPLLLKLLENVKENQILASLRDLLLPKLMSGEVRIPD
jgi:type I restriction enzyme S subunit